MTIPPTDAESMLERFFGLKTEIAVVNANVLNVKEGQAETARLLHEIRMEQGKIDTRTNVLFEQIVQVNKDVADHESRLRILEPMRGEFVAHLKESELAMQDFAQLKTRFYILIGALAVLETLAIPLWSFFIRPLFEK